MFQNENFISRYNLLHILIFFLLDQFMFRQKVYISFNYLLFLEILMFNLFPITVDEGGDTFQDNEAKRFSKELQGLRTNLSIFWLIYS